MHIAQKVFVVTGAGNGIGRETTLRLLAGGASVAGVDLNADGLAETARLAGAGDCFSPHVVDITDREAVAGLPAAVEAVARSGRRHREHRRRHPEVREGRSTCRSPRSRRS